MKKCILSAVFFLFLKISVGQYSLMFCESVSADGIPEKAATSFAQKSEGRAVNLFVRADEGFDTDQLKFTIYFMNAEGNEEEISKLPQTIEPGWNYIWKEVSLFNAGTYRVKVYNAKGTYLTSANMTIKSSGK
ncbi:MAG: hypothetical protein V4615_16625 [Bacteroidota bacterium]